MNQQKIGAFMRSLRKEKGLTQEQLAEIFNVSNRTVSRWENGNNMPDLDVLIEISDFYEVDLREILDGERRNEEMDNDMKETVLKAAEYATDDWSVVYETMRWMMVAAVIIYFVSKLISHTPLIENEAVYHISEFILGASNGLMFGSVIVTTALARKFRKFKKRIQKQMK